MYLLRWWLSYFPSLSPTTLLHIKYVQFWSDYYSLPTLLCLLLRVKLCSKVGLVILFAVFSFAFHGVIFFSIEFLVHIFIKNWTQLPLGQSFILISDHFYLLEGMCPAICRPLPVWIDCSLISVCVSYPGISLHCPFLGMHHMPPGFGVFYFLKNPPSLEWISSYMKKRVYGVNIWNYYRSWNNFILPEHLTDCLAGSYFQSELSDMVSSSSRFQSCCWKSEMILMPNYFM